MAVVSLSMTLFDNKGEESIITFYSSDTFTLATLANALRSMIPIIGNLTNGGLRPKARVSVDVDLTTSAQYTNFDTPLIGSDVEEGAFVEFNSTDPNSIKKNRIPTFDEAFIVPGTREVDTTATEWLAFQIAMLSGLATTDGSGNPVTLLFNDKYENDLTSLLAAYEQFQSSRTR